MDEGAKKGVLITAMVVVLVIAGLVIARTMSQPQETIDTKYLQKGAPGGPAGGKAPSPAPTLNPSKM